MKKTPFYESGLEYGANMVEAFGYNLPLHYSEGHHKEHQTTRESVSLCDLDYMAVFAIGGPDALKLIQNLATNDYSKKTIGSIQYTALCNDDGLMIDDCTIWRTGEETYLIISGSEDDYEWISKHAARHDVTVNNITDEHTTLSVQGPNAKRVLQGLVDIDLSRISFYRFQHAKIAGVNCIVGRLGFTGEAGFEVHFPSKEGKAFWDLIMEAGKPYGIAPCGQAALESLRQEAGFLLVGQDHDTSTNPFEAGICFTVKLSKDDFIGKAALENIAREGVSRQMVWLDVSSKEEVSIGDRVVVDDKEIGTVTSSSFSPTRKRGTAMAYVDSNHAIPGLGVRIKSLGDRLSEAKLSVVPLYDPGKTRTKHFL